MNLTLKLHRINNPERIEIDVIEKELQDGKHVIVQFMDKTYTDQKLSELNLLCEKYDENFGVRFYGHYSSSFDFKTLQKIPNVKRLSVDGLMKGDNISVLTELTKLKSLALGVFDMKETEILKAENLQRLSTLIITETKSKALNLDYLRNYKNLHTLIIGEQTKNIEAVGEISNLEFLSLNSIKKIPVSFINKLDKLKTLNFILGGRENIHEIEENSIENLKIIWVRGFNDISNIAKFRKLKTLLIENNIQLSKIHFDNELNYLNDLKIVNCKTLGSLSGLENLTSLKQLRIYKTNIDFETVINQNLTKTLKTFAFYTTKKKIDEEIKLKLENRGYSEYSEK